MSEINTLVTMAIGFEQPLNLQQRTLAAMPDETLPDNFKFKDLSASAQKTITGV